MIRTPPHKQPPPPHHPPHRHENRPPTATRSTDEQQHTKRHTLDRFRGTMGRTLAPSGMPHALSLTPSVPSRTPSPVWVCARA